MPIFSRRSVQWMLRQTAWHLGEEQIKRYVDLFNAGDEHSIPFQWELAFLHALTFIGRVVHEPRENAATLLDAHVFPYDAATPRFACEITTVSSESLHVQNPIEDFRNVVARLIRKRGLDPSHFGVTVGSERIESRADIPVTEYYYQGTPGSPKERFMIPAKAAMYDQVRNDITPLLDRIRQNDPDTDHLNVVSEDINYRVHYAKGRRLGLHGGSRVYDLAFSLRKNPVYRAMERKRDKLKLLSPKHGHRGIILCDGDCGIMTTRHHSPTGYYFTIDQIVHSFLRKRKEDVDWVLTASLASHLGTFLRAGVGHDGNYLDVKLYHNPNSTRPLPAQGMNAILAACEYMPTPLVSSSEIGDVLKRNPRTRGDHDTLGCKMIGWGRKKEIKLSARILLKYLAGEITKEEFERSTGVHRGSPNQFKHAIIRDELISNMWIEREAHYDDDWAVIELKADDVARSDFKMEGWLMRRIKGNRVVRHARHALRAAQIERRR